MYKSLALVGLAVSLSAASFGAPVCISQSLANYVALGATGCSLDSAVFAKFTIPSGQTGATPIPAANIRVDPITTAGMPGFTFNINSSASNSAFLEALFSYQVLGGPYSTETQTLLGAAVTGDGTVTSVQNLCIGGTFGPDGVSQCTGSPRSLILLKTATDSMLSDSVTFKPASVVSVTDDVTLDAGSTGTASLTAVKDQFATPEPSTLLVFSSGIAGLALLRRRRACATSALPVGEGKD